jgi:TfoX/Sxy family transcriptional regulator of competence genes
VPYNQHLDDRINKVVGKWQGVTRKKMFGGTAHLLNGNMLVGVYKDYLIVRLSEEQFADALKRPAAKPMDITGKPMKGWLMVSERGWTKDPDLKMWISEAKKFVKTLPKK